MSCLFYHKKGFLTYKYQKRFRRRDKRGKLDIPNHFPTIPVSVSVSGRIGSLCRSHCFQNIKYSCSAHTAEPMFRICHPLLPPLRWCASCAARTCSRLAETGLQEPHRIQPRRVLPCERILRPGEWVVRPVHMRSPTDNARSPLSAPQSRLFC